MDDTQEKTEKIKSVLLGKCLLNEENIKVETSINSGRKNMSENAYDLLILDLVMPIDEGDEVDAQGNSELFIEEMYRVGRLKKPAYIIALTQYESKIIENSKNYSKKLWKLIHYDLKETDWEDVLQDAVETIISTKTQLKKDILKDGLYDIGILCTLPVEFEQMRLAMGVKWSLLKSETLPFDFYIASMRTENGNSLKIIANCTNTPGMQAISVIASYMLSHFSVSNLFLTGFCAGFRKEDVRLGDLFIAESEYDYGSGKLEKNEVGQVIKPEPRVMPCSYHLISQINRFISEEKIKTKLYAEMQKMNLLENEGSILSIHVSPGACGSYVVNDEDFMNKLLRDDNRKLKGLDMEGYGLYLAGHMLKRNCVLIKGIADYGDGLKNDKYHKVCSYASAWFVMRFIKSVL